MKYKVYVKFKSTWYIAATTNSKLLAYDIQEMLLKEYKLLEVKVEEEE